MLLLIYAEKFKHDRFYKCFRLESVYVLRIFAKTTGFISVFVLFRSSGCPRECKNARKVNDNGINPTVKYEAVAAGKNETTLVP